jgi:acetyltransferase-like isoleucine patch superfamily enzyme
VEKAAITPQDEPPPIAIQQALGARGKSALGKYQDLVVGSRSLVRLVLHELGRNVVFGQGTVLRHPAKIHLGDGVTIDDLVVLDAKGTSNRGIVLGHGVFLGRGTILSCKNGDIVLGDHVNVGFHCEIFSGSSVTVGKHGLFAAYTYLVGGGHEFERPDQAVLEQPRSSRGISLGENVWLGAGAKVLDGVRIGRDVVVGAGAVVTSDLPDGVVAVGIPARVVRRRGEAADGATSA